MLYGLIPKKDIFRGLEELDLNRLTQAERESKQQGEKFFQYQKELLKEAEAGG